MTESRNSWTKDFILEHVLDKVLGETHTDLRVHEADNGLDEVLHSNRRYKTYQQNGKTVVEKIRYPKNRLNRKRRKAAPSCTYIGCSSLATANQRPSSESIEAMKQSVPKVKPASAQVGQLLNQHRITPNSRYEHNYSTVSIASMAPSNISGASKKTFQFTTTRTGIEKQVPVPGVTNLGNTASTNNGRTQKATTPYSSSSCQGSVVKAAGQVQSRFRPAILGGNKKSTSVEQSSAPAESAHNSTPEQLVAAPYSDSVPANVRDLSLGNRIMQNKVSLPINVSVNVHGIGSGKVQQMTIPVSAQQMATAPLSVVSNTWVALQNVLGNQTHNSQQMAASTVISSNHHQRTPTNNIVKIYKRYMKPNENAALAVAKGNSCQVIKVTIPGQNQKKSSN